MFRIKSRKVASLMVAVILTTALFIIIAAVSCSSEPKDDDKEDSKQEVVYKPNSTLGIAESYVGKDVQDLIEAVGELKKEPDVKPANDGGGYEGFYEFEGFSVKTYAKSANAKNVVTEIIPDKESDVYKDSIEKDPEGTK